jgi:hypothetical protein
MLTQMMLMLTTGSSCSCNADTGEDVCVPTVTFLFCFYFGHRQEINDFSAKQNLARHTDRILRGFGNFGGIFGGVILEGEGGGEAQQKLEDSPRGKWRPFLHTP